MGSVEMSVNEEGALKVVQHYDIRALLRRLQPQCCQRPRVVHCLQCSGLSGYVNENKFNRVLLCCFLASLALAAINVFMSEKRLTDPHPHPYYGRDYRHQQTLAFGFFEIGQTEKALLAMFAAILAVGVLAKKVPRRFCSSLPPPETKVQSVSHPVMHV